MGARAEVVTLPGRCAVCTREGLERHLEVAVDAGDEGLVPSTLRFGSAASDIVRCASCGHMQVASMPSGPSLIDSYGAAESTDYLAEERGQRRTARTALEAIERHVRPGRLLDVGCWVGFLLDEARSRGWEVTGLEPSAFASGYARERFDLDVRTFDLFAGGLEPRSFDAVVLADVIEHLPDPGAALERITQLAVPEAILYLALPDAGSRIARVMGRRWWSVLPTHVQYFTRSSLATLLARQGWEVLETATAPKAFTVRYYLGRVEGYSPALSRALVRIAEIARGAEQVWAPDFRDRLAVVARAPREDLRRRPSPT